MAPPDKRARGSKDKQVSGKKGAPSRKRFQEGGSDSSYKAKSAGKKKFSSKGSSWGDRKKRPSKGFKPRAADRERPERAEGDGPHKPWSKGPKRSYKGGRPRTDGDKSGFSSDKLDRHWGERKKRDFPSDRPPGERKRGGPPSDRPWVENKKRGENTWSEGRRREGGNDRYRARDEFAEVAPASQDVLPQLVATCALGLELTVGRELEALGLGPIKRDNAQVSFPFTPQAVAKANYWLRTADRVWLQLAEFPVRDFEELFQGVKAIDWPSMLPQDAEFPVEVISTKSKLENESSCQAVSKKAAVERMQEVYGRSQFPETGPRFAIRVFIVYNRARVFIDTSGEGLHRRGYRTYNAKAPLRETVAAALVLLSHWSSERELYDPMCGSGTILLEAASIGLKKAPGLERSFAAQRWKFLGRECWEEAHQEALELYDRRTQLKLFGSDLDGRVLKLARTHLAQADLEGRGVYFQTRDLVDFSSQRKYGVVITNPPYGRRLNSLEEVEELTRTMAEVFEPLAETWSLYFYTGYEEFADVYGRRPDRVRKIYNGRLEANLLQYPGPKPPSYGSGDDAGGTSERVKRIPLSP